MKTKELSPNTPDHGDVLQGIIVPWIDRIVSDQWNRALFAGLVSSLPRLASETTRCQIEHQTSDQLSALKRTV